MSKPTTTHRARDERAISERFVERFVPALKTAGAYARQIQSAIRARPVKDGDPWTSVLTDADLGVQHFIETIMLGEFPDWHFHGEEHEASFNTRYFNDSDVSVWLDPVNGTRLYRDGADGFDLLLSLTVAGRLCATLSYMPARREFFGATRHGGAFHIGADGDRPRALAAPSEAATLAVYQAERWRALLPTTIDVFDVIDDYHADDPRCCMNSLFTGELGGFLFGDVALLDVGATAFTAALAGGVSSLPDGRALDCFDAFSGTRRSDLLVCSNPLLHREVSAAIRAALG